MEGTGPFTWRARARHLAGARRRCDVAFWSPAVSVLGSMDSHGTRLAGFGDTTGCGSGARRGLGSQPGPTPAANKGGRAPLVLASRAAGRAHVAAGGMVGHGWGPECRIALTARLGLMATSHRSVVRWRSLSLLRPGSFRMSEHCAAMRCLIGSTGGQCVPRRFALTASFATCLVSTCREKIWAFNRTGAFVVLLPGFRFVGVLFYFFFLLLSAIWFVI